MGNEGQEDRESNERSSLATKAVTGEGREAWEGMRGKSNRGKNTKKSKQRRHPGGALVNSLPRAEAVGASSSGQAILSHNLNPSARTVTYQVFELLGSDRIVWVNGVVDGKVFTESYSRRRDVPTREEHLTGQYADSIVGSRDAISKGLSYVHEGSDQRIGMVWTGKDLGQVVLSYA